MTGRTLIIAEAGVNHDGYIQKAYALIDAAKDAGADIVKFQTFRAASLASARAPKAEYQTRTTDAGESQQAMLKRLELSPEAHAPLKAHAEKLGLQFLSTPFDLASADLLLDLGLPVIKIGSGDLTNAPLLLKLAQAQRALIISTGMSDLAEIEESLGVLAFGYAQRQEPPGQRAFAAAWVDPRARATLTDKVTLLHCTTEYPSPPADANLGAIATLRKAFGLPVGFSDHCEDPSVAVAAVALGATVIEKHLTLDRRGDGPDHAASLEPGDFKRLTQAIRTVEAALGDGVKVPRPSEIKNIPIARKSLVAARPIRAGQVLSEADIAVKRPGGGKKPIAYWDLVGTVAPRALEQDEPIDP